LTSRSAVGHGTMSYHRNAFATIGDENAKLRSRLLQEWVVPWYPSRSHVLEQRPSAFWDWSAQCPHLSFTSQPCVLSHLERSSQAASVGGRIHCEKYSAGTGTAMASGVGSGFKLEPMFTLVLIPPLRLTQLRGENGNHTRQTEGAGSLSHDAVHVRSHHRHRNATYPVMCGTGLTECWLFGT
jgi:hypothetical protein